MIDRFYHRRRRELRAAAEGRNLPPHAIWEIGADGQRRNVAHLWSLVQKSPDADGCWLWTGSLRSDGYGQYGGRGGAHREAYRHLIGQIPTGLQLDHLCRVILCVNPSHLEPVTRAENMRRSAALRTHCPHGHEWTEQNTAYQAATGARRCRACTVVLQRQKRARRRALLAVAS